MKIFRTYAKTAKMLGRGDVIKAPDNTLHRVTEWEPYPTISIFFKTDTGLEIEKEWYDPSEYDVLAERPDDDTLEQLRSM